MGHINLFQTVAEFESAYTNDYIEPWVSYTIEGSGLTYNKKSGPVPPHDYSQDYLTFVMLTSGSIQTENDTIQFSVDGGETWVKEINNLEEGDNVLVRGHYINSQSSAPFSMSGHADVQGNILSIYDADNFKTRTSLDSDEHMLSALFTKLGIISAENLILPLTALTNACYDYLFFSCTGLTTAPELPATTLADSCYQYMFSGCTSLTTAPELPATTLASNCYQGMFTGCRSLTTSPELPATTLAWGCYMDMFDGCTSLNYIKCLATDISASYCTDNWVVGVSSTGTFVKDASMTSWTTGDYGIPNNWTVQDAS